MRIAPMQFRLLHSLLSLRCQSIISIIADLADERQIVGYYKQRLSGAFELIQVINDIFEHHFVIQIAADIIVKHLNTRKHRVTFITISPEEVDT